MGELVTACPVDMAHQSAHRVTVVRGRVCADLLYDPPSGLNWARGIPGTWIAGLTVGGHHEKRVYASRDGAATWLATAFGGEHA